jgi:hypothetical protein
MSFSVFAETDSLTLFKNIDSSQINWNFFSESPSIIMVHDIYYNKTNWRNLYLNADYLQQQEINISDMSIG